MSEYKRGFSLGFLLLKIGLGIFFIISGILILQGSASEPCIIAIRSIVKARIADTLCVVMGIVELAVGVMLLLSVFVCFGKTLNALFMPIIMIVWIMAIALIDVFGTAGLLNGFGGNFMNYASRVSSHLIILGSIILLK